MVALSLVLLFYVWHRLCFSVLNFLWCHGLVCDLSVCHFLVVNTGYYKC